MKEKPAVEVRLDKWLWAARFYKTRALAREMIEGGKVHYNGQRSKPSKIVELNATLTLRQGNDERTVIVKAITEQRRPASEAALLYEETAESVEKREKMALARKLNALTMPHPDRRQPLRQLQPAEARKGLLCQGEGEPRRLRGHGEAQWLAGNRHLPPALPMRGRRPGMRRCGYLPALEGVGRGPHYRVITNHNQQH